MVIMPTATTTNFTTTSTFCFTKLISYKYIT
jgi:hypothetical protein